MSKEVLLRAFKKAEKEIGSSKKTHLSTHISEILLEDFKYTVSERSLRDYYTNYLNGTTAVQEDLKPKLIECLCRYLGYKNYAEFVRENSNGGDVKERVSVTSGIKKDFKKKFGKVGAIAAIPLLVLTGAVGYNGFVVEEENCMIWVQDHFESTICKGSEFEQPHEKMTMEKMKKVVVFDTIDKGDNLWYDKSDNELEFFTSPGIHPTNGKTLKPVTTYIYQKYIVKEKGFE
ncbi:hypothetical protein [Sediminicola arcticus]|uniref:Uncharacterized protein n=1 Tax=Sediminicola arcticus TaxID=1574308 RepID=A0ABV2SPT6_9FLAO